MNEQSRAKAWHDTDHGVRRWGRRRSPPGVIWRKQKDTRPVSTSSCWCCCDLCDPDFGHDRPNPFWSAAQKEMST